MMLYFDVFVYGVDERTVAVLKEALDKFEESDYEINVINEVPPTLLNSARNQFKGDEVNRWLSSLRTREGSIVVGVLNVDAYVQPLNFIFGLATPNIRVASVYLKRLMYHATEDVYLKRVFKEVLHEIGHILGLEHCTNRRCVMCFSNSVYDVDEKEGKFCKKHFSQLIKKGIAVNETLLLT